jgi:tRNA A37 threonylcarbamoyladenosine synthetase subunit TsaC/SUA5/YrdC
MEILRERPELDAVDGTVLAIDAGAVHGRLPSTIVTCVERPSRLLREGPVSRQQIQAVLPELQ